MPLVRRPVYGQLNGSVDNKIVFGSTDPVQLFEHGTGNRLGWFSEAPIGEEQILQDIQAAIKHIQGELPPQLPAYSTARPTSTQNRRKQYRKSRIPDLKDLASYYVNGKPKSKDGVQHLPSGGGDGNPFSNENISIASCSSSMQTKPEPIVIDLTLD